jgi:type I site-specific restriction-modification system R (restriction) subunit
MQKIARGNRVFRGKPGGLVVDYLGLADQLRMALADYTAADRYSPRRFLSKEASGVRAASGSCSM